MNCQFCQQHLSYPENKGIDDTISQNELNHLLFCAPCQTLYRMENKQLAAIILLTIIRGEEYRFVSRLEDSECYIWAPYNVDKGGVIMYFDSWPNITPANINNKIKTYLLFQ